MAEVDNDPDLDDEEISASNDDVRDDTPVAGSSSCRQNHGSADSVKGHEPATLGPGSGNTPSPTNPDTEGEEELFEVEKLMGCKTIRGENITESNDKITP